MKIFALIVLLLIPSAVQADTKTITSDASYFMGDGETPDFAEERTLQKAKQAALEEAGTYVQSYTKVQNLNLTTDEIQTIAGGILQVEILEKTRTLISDGLRFYTKIRATVSTEKMEELARRIKGKDAAEEYTKLQADYARLNDELENLKRLVAKTPEGPQRDAALEQLRIRAKTFSYIRKMESALFERLVSGASLAAGIDSKRAKIDGLIAEIRERGHLIKIGPINTFLLPQEETYINKNPARPKPNSQRVIESREKWFPWGNWPLAEAKQEQQAPKSDESIDTVAQFPITVEPAPELRGMLSRAALQLDHFDPEIWEDGPFKVLISNVYSAQVHHYNVFIVRDSFSYRGSINDLSHHPYHRTPDLNEKGRGQFSIILRADGFRVKLSRQPDINQYFSSRLRQMVLVVRFMSQDSAMSTCLVEGLLPGRVLPIVQSSYGEFSSYSHVDQETSQVLVLDSPLTLLIDYKISGAILRKLTSVTASFEENPSGNLRYCAVKIDA